jgi:hypothetical protein
MAGPGQTTIRIDLRAALPVLILGIIILAIIFVELCGRTDIKPLPQGTPFIEGPTSTPGPTSTAGPSPTESPAEATATQENAAAGSDRDEVRVRDLASIQGALQQYKQKHGKYPSTGGGIQTVCTFEQDDKGCAIKETVAGGTVPQDPLGNGGMNGYWLQSTETAYTLFAQRESELFPACDQAKPDHLKIFRTVFCVHGP